MVHLIIEFLLEYAGIHADGLDDESVGPVGFKDVRLELLEFTKFIEILVLVLPCNKLGHVERYSFGL